MKVHNFSTFPTYSESMQIGWCWSCLCRMDSWIGKCIYRWHTSQTNTRKHTLVCMPEGTGLIVVVCTSAVHLWGYCFIWNCLKRQTKDSNILGQRWIWSKLNNTAHTRSMHTRHSSSKKLCHHSWFDSAIDSVIGWLSKWKQEIDTDNWEEQRHNSLFQRTRSRLEFAKVSPLLSSLQAAL